MNNKTIRPNKYNFVKNLNFLQTKIHSKIQQNLRKILQDQDQQVRQKKVEFWLTR